VTTADPALIISMTTAIYGHPATEPSMRPGALYGAKLPNCEGGVIVVIVKIEPVSATPGMPMLQFLGAMKRAAERLQRPRDPCGFISLHS
jgi:hypothetical protein